MNFLLKIGLKSVKSAKSAKSASKSQQPLYICRESSTNPPFFAKQTQFSPFIDQKRGFFKKTNPKQTQSNPIQTQYLLKKRYDKPKQTQNKPKLIPLGQSGQFVSRNRRKRKGTTSRFLGVCFYRHKGKWASRIETGGKRISLGLFDSEIDAARAYDEAAKKYYGEFARLNFPQESEESRALFTRIGKTWAKLKKAIA